MCRSIAAWAEVGKPKLSAEADDIQPIIDSIQVSLLPRLLLQVAQSQWGLCFPGSPLQSSNPA